MEKERKKKNTKFCNVLLDLPHVGAASPGVVSCFVAPPHPAAAGGDEADGVEGGGAPAPPHPAAGGGDEADGVEGGGAPAPPLPAQNGPASF